MDSQTKERPIIFSTPMVRAVIEGRKTMTRRVVNMPIAADAEDVFVWYAGELRKSPNRCAEDGLYERTPRGLAYLGRCPFGNVGDRLWVKSTHWHKPASDLIPERIWHPELELLCSRDHGGMYEDRHATELQTMDVGGFRKRPSIHMPRWASRPTLTITDVRVERLQDISGNDAKAEGVEPCDVHGHDDCFHGLSGQGYKCAFEALWNGINGPGAWDANPWVWALTFTTEVRK